MSLITSNCWIRKCVNYIGIKSDDEDDPNACEVNERHVCKAFPDKIPNEISQGNNTHVEPYEGDHGIQYEKIMSLQSNK